jgi:hypothetical protein
VELPIKPLVFSVMLLAGVVVCGRHYSESRTALGLLRGRCFCAGESNSKAQKFRVWRYPNRYFARTITTMQYGGSLVFTPVRINR